MSSFSKKVPSGKLQAALCAQLGTCVARCVALDSGWQVVGLFDLFDLIYGLQLDK